MSLGQELKDPRFIRGVDLFNREEYFEAHEVWEDLWHETQGRPRDFIQGLIQVTSALHHLEIGNMRGARILHGSGLELLAPYGALYGGIDLDRLRSQFSRAMEGLLEPPLEQLAGRAGTGGPVRIPFGPERRFKIDVQTL